MNLPAMLGSFTGALLASLLLQIILRAALQYPRATIPAIGATLVCLLQYVGGDLTPLMMTFYIIGSIIGGVLFRKQNAGLKKEIKVEPSVTPALGPQ